MDLKQIKELISLIEKSKIKKITIKEKNGTEISLEKETPFDSSIDLSLASRQAMAALSQSSSPHMASLGDKPAPKEEKVTKSEDQATYITSPMVGSFYRSPSPGQPPFVKEGDKVSKDSVVCIIEAMKVMNEVKAGVAGTVKEACLENGHAVEFGTKLFRIE